MQILNCSARLQANSLVEHANRKQKTEIHAFHTILSILRNSQILSISSSFLLIPLPQLPTEIPAAEFYAFPNQYPALHYAKCRKKFLQQNFVYFMHFKFKISKLTTAHP